MSDDAQPRQQRRRPTRAESGTPRPRRIPTKRITRDVLRAGRVGVERELATLDDQRPRTRAECRDAIRPCPWASCKHHLYLDINPETGSIIFNRPDLDLWELVHTCALDVAEFGGITLDEVGEIMNVTRERIRQLEVRALLKLKRSPATAELGS